MENVNEVVVEVTEIALLSTEGKVSNVDIVTKLNEVIAKVNELMKSPSKVSKAGTREMTEDDAKRIMLGDLKDKSHKEAGEELGLSYGQIYSARKGFTFKKVYNDMLKANAESK